MKLNIYLDKETNELLNRVCSMGFSKSSIVRAAVRYYVDMLSLEDTLRLLSDEQGLDTNRSEYISSEKKWKNRKGNVYRFLFLILTDEMSKCKWNIKNF